MKKLLTIPLALICCCAGFAAEPTPTPAPTPRLAPSGIFFLKERFSQKTEFGVRALKAGTRVTLSKENGEMSVVVDENNNEFEVPSYLLTNDLDVRDALLKTIADDEKKLLQQAEAGAVLANQSREARVAGFEDEIKALQLRLDELELARTRTEDDLKVETAKSQQNSISGDAMMGERAARQRLSQIGAQIKKTERKIQDAQLSIKKEKLGE